MHGKHKLEALKELLALAQKAMLEGKAEEEMESKDMAGQMADMAEDEAALEGASRDEELYAEDEGPESFDDYAKREMQTRRERPKEGAVMMVMSAKKAAPAAAMAAKMRGSKKGMV